MSKAKFIKEMTPESIIKRLMKLESKKNDSQSRQFLAKKANSSFPLYANIAKFMNTHNLTDKYPIRDLYRWHTLMTASCYQGKDKFLELHNVNIEEDEVTLPEFFDAVSDEYGKEIIAFVRKKMEEKENEEK